MPSQASHHGFLSPLLLAGLAVALGGIQPTEAQDLQKSPAVEAKRAQISCPTAKELEALFKPLHQIDINLTPTAGQLPVDCSEELFARPTDASPTDESIDRAGRDWADTEYHWTPTELAHQPLYFDDVPLERYGQSVAPRFQPLISGARFFGTLPVLPYKVGLDRPFEQVTTLGYYRCGTPAPCVHQTLPLDPQAAFAEGGAWVGLLFLLP